MTERLRFHQGPTAPEKLADGELFVHPRTADYPIEWLVLRQEDSDRADESGVLVAPVDTHPLLGHGDVGVSSDSASGPLSIRSKLAFWAPLRVLGAVRKTGSVSESFLQEALNRSTANSEPTLFEEDVLADPEFREWRESVLEPACAELRQSPLPSNQGDPEQSDQPAATSTQNTMFHFRSWELFGLAASLLAVVGAAFLWYQNTILRTELDAFSQPVLDPSTAEIPMHGGVRSLSPIEITTASPWFEVVFLLPSRPKEGRVSLSITNSERQEIWSSGPFERSGRLEVAVRLPTKRFPDGAYRVELVDLSGAEKPSKRDLFIRSESNAASPQQ